MDRSFISNSNYLTNVAILMAAPLTHTATMMHHLCTVKKHILNITDMLQLHENSNSPTRLFVFGYMLGRLHCIMQIISNAFDYPIYHRLIHLKRYNITYSFYMIIMCHESATFDINQGFAIGYLQEHLLIQMNQLHDDHLSTYEKVYTLRDYAHVKKIFFDSVIVNFTPPLRSLVGKVFPSSSLNWKQIHNELVHEFQKMATVF